MHSPHHSLFFGVILSWLALSPVIKVAAATAGDEDGTAGINTTTSSTSSAVKIRTDLQAPPADTQWFHDVKFGIMVHMGPVNLTEREISWSRGGPRAGYKYGLRPGGRYTPVDVYDNLYKKYDPAKFDADQWVQIVKDAGAQFFVFTTKHHDGFVMFDSKLTDYKITSPESPFHRDLVKELADACHKADLKLGLYYSQPDWHHPDAFTKDHDKYLEYFHGQVRELLSNYGKVDILWFDGLLYNAKDWDSEGLFKMIRSIQPHVLVNNRVDFPYGAAGIIGDFDTPEGQIGAFENDRPWETVMPISKQWAWKRNDSIMTLEQCLRILLYVVGSDGNFLLNVGVMPDGEIDPGQVVRLKEIGAWLKKYGESIYGTRGGPYKPGLWGVSTFKDNTVYLHVMHWPHEPMQFPLTGNKILSSEVLTGGSVKVDQTDKYFSFTVAPKDRDPIDTVIKLQLSQPANSIPICNARYPGLVPYVGVTSFPKFTPKYATSAPQRALDNDWGTSWEMPPHGWIEVDFGHPVSIDQLAICEGRPAFRSAVRKFEVIYKKDAADPWQKLDSGTSIGPDYIKSFPPVDARYVRLNFLDGGRVGIRELHFFRTAK